ncbi:MAG TPA: hypothetical protein VI387_04280, partial [Candidatus Brocadiales bacterium]|nr:hypothetical protein [Candidatus Brocadiales bacterium]
QEFEKKLKGLTDTGWIFGSSLLQKLYVPVKELEEFRDMLNEIVGNNFFEPSPIDKLSVPLKDLEEYNLQLDETIEKLNEIEKSRAKIK